MLELNQCYNMDCMEGMLKRRNITKQEVDSVYGIAEVGRQ